MTRDWIVLTGMSFYGRHGVLPEEREHGQRFLVDVELETDLGRAGRDDDLSATVDYRRVYAVVREVVEGAPRSLIEAVAETIAGRLLLLSRAEGVIVRVRKPEVALGGPVEAAGVKIHRRRGSGSPGA